LSIDTRFYVFRNLELSELFFIEKELLLAIQVADTAQNYVSN